MEKKEPLFLHRLDRAFLSTISIVMLLLYLFSVPRPEIVEFVKERKMKMDVYQKEHAFARKYAKNLQDGVCMYLNDTSPNRFLLASLTSCFANQEMAGVNSTQELVEIFNTLCEGHYYLYLDSTQDIEIAKIYDGKIDSVMIGVNTRKRISYIDSHYQQTKP